MSRAAAPRAASALRDTDDRPVALARHGAVILRAQAASARDIMG